MNYESSFGGALKIILWIFIISFVIRLVARLALPHVIRKAEDSMRQRADQFNRQQQPPRREGEISIEKQQQKDNLADNGDYTDYVEIKD